MMIRKQVYIDERHERALKRRVKETGLSEAELVRQALDLLLSTKPRRPISGRIGALDELLLGAARTAKEGHRLPGKRLDRAALYEERERKLTRR